MQFSKEEWDLHGRPGKAHWAAWENSRRTLGDVSGQEISNPDADWYLKSSISIQRAHSPQNVSDETPCYGGSTNNNHNGTQMNSQEGMGAWFCMFSPFGHRVLWEYCANGVPIVEAKNTLHSLFLFSSFNGVWPIFRSLTSFPSPFLLICPLFPLIGIPAWASMVRETLGTIV